MVSLGDGVESSTDPNSVGSDGPNTMYDSDYCGLADDGDKNIHCKCNVVASKFVAFEAGWTGRRFLACSSEDGEMCDFVQWVDPLWPSPLQKSLMKLWENYTEARDGRVRDALNNVETRFKFTDEIAKLHCDLRNAQDELKQMVEEKQLTLALKAKAEEALVDARAELEEKKKLDASTCSMHKFLMLKAEKERDQFKEDKTRLENIIEDLLKQKEELRANIRKIKNTCDE